MSLLFQNEIETDTMSLLKIVDDEKTRKCKRTKGGMLAKNMADLVLTFDQRGDDAP